MLFMKNFGVLLVLSVFAVLMNLLAYPVALWASEVFNLPLPDFEFHEIPLATMVIGSLILSALSVVFGDDLWRDVKRAVAFRPRLEESQE